MTRSAPGPQAQGLTLPAVLVERARREPRQVAFRTKRLGIYRERTWAAACELVACCALGLRELGLRSGERAALLGDPREEWVICDLAVQALGAVSVGVYSTWTGAELEEALRESAPSVIVAEGSESLEGLLPLLPRLDGLKRLVILDAAAAAGCGLPRSVSFAQVLSAGREALAGEEATAALERLAGELDPEGPAVLLFSSGTGGRPKPAALSHAGQLAGARALVDHYPLLRRAGHRTVAYLPLAHALGRQSAITVPFVSGVVPHFGESLEQLPQTFFEVAPTVLFTAPRYLQRLASRIRTGLADSRGVKRRVGEAALYFGKRHAAARRSGRPSLFGRIGNAAFRLAVFRPILNKLGFDRLELVLCGAAPLPSEVVRFWHVLGVNVVQVYGLTEAGGAVAGQASPFPDPSAPMRALPGIEVRLGPGGQLLVSGDHIHPERAEQWLATGDLGTLEEGGLRVLGRSSDLIPNADGRSVLSAAPEGALRESPFIAEALVVGDGRQHLAALLELDRAALVQWARERGATYGGATSLNELPEVLALVRGIVDEANRRVPEGEAVRFFRILPAPLDPEGELLTPLHVPKRRACLEVFRDLIEALYDSEGSPAKP